MEDKTEDNPEDKDIENIARAVYGTVQVARRSNRNKTKNMKWGYQSKPNKGE